MTLHRRGSAPQRLVANELPPAARSAVIDAYRSAAGRVVSGYWEALPDDEEHPVFQLEPTT